MSPSVTQTSVGRRLRRSKRLGLGVQVQAYGQNIFGESFREFTRMISVNAHGGLIALAANVQEGQTILVVNRNTREEQECRVVYLGSLQDGKWRVGVEFVHPAPDFWRIHFPPLERERPRSKTPHYAR